MSIKAKEHPCKGTGIAAGHGCGKMQFERRYGLGIRCCFSTWLRTTKEGEEIIKKSTITAKKEVTKIRKAKDKETRESLKTHSDYLAGLQKEINSIVRLIDSRTFCISSMRPLNPKFDAGHYYSVGSNPSIRFNLFNIYAQSVHENQHKGGNPIEFLSGLKIVYGLEHSEYVQDLKRRYPVLKLSIPEIQEATSKARVIVKYLKEQDKTYLEPSERLRLRGVFNYRIGIYTNG
jgi:hypothetical protein